MGEKIICPECNNEISTDDLVCPHCGYPIGEDKIKVDKCPECGNDVNLLDEKCSVCGYPLKEKVNKNAKNIPDSKKRILGIAMIVVGILLVFFAYKTRFMSDYDYNAGVIERYEDNIKEYRDLKQEMMDEANSYSSGLFKTSYKNLAYSYQELIDDAEESIGEYQGKQRAIVTKALIMLLISLGLIGTGGYFIKKNSGGIA